MEALVTAASQPEIDFAGVFDSCATACVIADPSNSRIMKINQAAEQMFGYARHAMEGRRLFDFLSGDRRETARHVRAELMKGGEHRFTCSVRKGDASVAHVHALARLAGSTREPMLHLSFFDMTELSDELLSLREARRKAEEAARLKDTFVALIAHDLRSPLTTLMSILQYACHTSPDDLAGKLGEILTRAADNCKGLLGMIDELLEISRINSGELRPRRGFIKTRLLVENIISRLRDMGASKGVSLINQISDNSRVYADPALFGEVIHNLVSNAIKFSRKGDEVTVLSPSPEAPVIAVKDRGVGIAPGVAPHLFKQEVRTTTKGTAGEAGTGLGLPLCHDIMVAHGGTLFVESEPGRGSTFYASLPNIQPTIMVVDGDDADRFACRDYLQLIGASVVEASDGDMALNALKNTLPHLMVVAVTRSGANGFTLIEELRRRRRPMNERFPIIAATGDPSGDVREKAFRLGALDVITKPVLQHEFIPRVQRVLEIGARWIM